MQERLASLQGKLYTHSQKDEGTIVTCTIPNQANEGSQKIKILLADDQPLIRESLKLLLGEEKDFEVTVITTIEDVSYAAEALHSGAEGYILKSIHPKELAATIQLVYGGGTMISQDMAQQLFHHEMKDTAKNPYELTERELDVLQCLMEGLRNKAIAQRLYLSEGTIRNYISSIYLKMQVQGREEAVEKARNEHLIS
ncbi:LuxR C-terminal-related transcriptional regulator [Paenibacillus sp. N3/727]|uniref:response regulator transcription factor n=1 Tax=Paenibacillus sp. N3/727 TaxID=2925845 RepID=UPI001F53BA7C|nr:LuxR C-terminal-related transcriptional regulator [Paenibacillus sp. N3/727]UNK19065.1 LuxR C-terminal-related transcriptional regulator [Paenibacillus sp. N3/727]